jgi:AraC-like DNA-binding protein
MSTVNADMEAAEDATAVLAVGELSASDPAIYEQIVQPWELCNTPLERGDFGYRIRYLQTPAITLYEEQFDLHCRVRGLSPPGVFTFTVPLCHGTDSTCWKEPWCRSGFSATLPGGVDATLAAGQTHLIALVNRSLLRSHLPAELVNSLDQAARHHLLPVTSLEVERFGKWLLALLDGMNHRPQLLQYPAVMQSLEEDLIYRLANVVQLPSTNTTRQDSAKCRTGLERALEFLRVADLSSLTIPQLSEAAGISLRNLEYAFRKTFDLTPIGFIRLQRFHAARQQLTAASPGQTTVAQVAYDNGFYHLGRFSADYQRLFGELPSKTLLQYYRNPGGGLSPLAGCQESVIRGMGIV